MRLSIIIPTLNEAACIADTIRAVRAKAICGEPEIIVSDCGSPDGTADIAHALKVRVTSDKSLASRAEAANRGVHMAKGDALFFLDADTIPPHGYDEAIISALSETGARPVVGGAFEFAFDGEGLALRFIELVNRIRYRIFQEYYSDQGVFAEKEAFMRVGGFPARRLMETSHLCVALRREGRLRLIRTKILTSPRRFTEGGTWRVFLRDVMIWFLDAAGRTVDKFADQYKLNNVVRGDQKRMQDIR